jgi:hypothetical protein
MLLLCGIEYTWVVCKCRNAPCVLVCTLGRHWRRCQGETRPCRWLLRSSLSPSSLEHAIPGLANLGLHLVHLALVCELAHDHNPVWRSKDDDGVEALNAVLRGTC